MLRASFTDSWLNSKALGKSVTLISHACRLSSSIFSWRDIIAVSLLMLANEEICFVEVIPGFGSKLMIS
jgi:hypothetical protein